MLGGYGLQGTIQVKEGRDAITLADVKFCSLPPDGTQGLKDPRNKAFMQSAEVCCALCLVRVDVLCALSRPFSCVVHTIAPALLFFALCLVHTAVLCTLSRPRGVVLCTLSRPFSCVLHTIASALL